jgi:hypothetical protein
MPIYNQCPIQISSYILYNDNAIRMSNSALQEAKRAISKLQRATYWKPGRDIQHLNKRKALGHLPKDCQIKDYNELIRELVQGLENEVYLYEFGSQRYYMIEGRIKEKEWIVIFSTEGIIETAFPPYDIEDYLSKRDIALLGKVGEIVK